MVAIADRARKIVVETLGVEPIQVDPSLVLRGEAFRKDPMLMTGLIMEFECEFDCEIPDDAQDSMLTFGDAVKFLETHAKAR